MCAGQDKTLLKTNKGPTASGVNGDPPPGAHGDIPRRIGFYTARQEKPDLHLLGKTPCGQTDRQTDRQGSNTRNSCGILGLPGPAPLPFPAGPLGILCPGMGTKPGRVCSIFPRSSSNSQCQESISFSKLFFRLSQDRGTARPGGTKNCHINVVTLSHQSLSGRLIPHP